MGLVQMSCAGCGAQFERHSAEMNRHLRRNPERKFYCSRSCYAKNEGKNRLGPMLGLGRPELLVPGKLTDQYSPFRYFMRKARNRELKDPTDLDLPFLKELWEKQEGRCALSGLRMELPKHATAWGERLNDPWKPSLDRIDSSVGYIKINVRFVTVIANFAKQNFSDEQLFAFCRAVTQHHNTTSLEQTMPYERPPSKRKAKEERSLWRVSLAA
jgi:hypothetical protein